MALVLWTFVMWAWLYATRIPAIRKNKIVMDPQRPGGELLAQLPAEVRWKADNYNNLMEQPTLFYAVALTLALLDADAGLNTGLAWRLALCWSTSCSQSRTSDRQYYYNSLRHFYGCLICTARDGNPCGDDYILTCLACARDLSLRICEGCKIRHPLQ